MFPYLAIWLIGVPFILGIIELVRTQRSMAGVAAGAGTGRSPVVEAPPLEPVPGRA